ncbi:MAG TPA: beta-galactosidase [Opitutaceae bacterium]|nr:beta-galactosidase [Opitutaceae bacterium]
MTRLRSLIPATALAFVSLLTASLRAQVVTHITPDGRAHKFELREKQFWIDGEPTLLVAGEMHFGRVLPEDWALRIKQAKAMGLNTLSFYLFWNLCEPREGEFQFSGMTDVRRMLQLCQENGMWVILRPGPYCCAEVDYGGLPWWTAKYPDVKIRSNDPQYLAWSRRYIEQVARQVGDLQVTHGGPLLMVQMENEFAMISRGGNEHLQALQKIFRAAGFDVPLFTGDPFLMPVRDPAQAVPGVLRGRNGLRNERDYQQTVTANGGDLPVYAPEVYTAWFSGWGQPIATRNASVPQIASWTTALLNQNASFCYYMFFGGTNFGFSSGCNEYLPLQTSYDYGAPIDEAGRVTEKYRALRTLLAERLKITPPDIPADPAVIKLPTIKLPEHEPLLDWLSRRASVSQTPSSADTRAASARQTPYTSRIFARPLSMEELDQAYGFVLYRKKFPAGIKGVLELKNARDYTVVMINGRTVAESFVGLGLDTNKIALDASGPVTLDLLVHNLGRISVITSSRSQDRARKGLESASLDGAELRDWEMFSLPLESVKNFRSTDASVTGPTFYRGTFDVEKPAGTFLDLRNWSFGVVWVNGHNLGRFWDRGALRSVFVPGHWLEPGRNEIVVLELHDPPRVPEIASDTRIVETPAVPFPVRLDRAVLQPPAATP